VGILREPAEVVSPSTGEQSVHFPCFGGLQCFFSPANASLQQQYMCVKISAVKIRYSFCTLYLVEFK